MKFRTGVPAALAVAVVAAPAAQAHVTVQPNEVEAGGFARLDVRVPNEKDDASTEKVVVQMPDGFYFVGYEPVPGWKVKIKKEKLATPVEEHGEKITEQVDTVTFSGGKIRPGQFQDFGLSVGVPEGKPDSELVFKALQTYSDGETVRWIEDNPEGEKPAARVKLLAAEPAPAANASASSGDDDDDSSNTLGIIALIVGLLGLAAGAAALLAGRRSRTA